MIPKIIHYCWFGNGKMPKLYKKCIASWSVYAPDYKVVLWDESSFDVNSIQFTKDAYLSKKYAFVSDYVRLYALTTIGGIYLDTDIELLKPIDSLLLHKGFAGFETKSVIQTGVLGCESGNNVFTQFFNQYSIMSFNNNAALIPNSAIFSTLLVNRGLVLDDTLQMIDDICIYPQDYFCPIDQATRQISPTDNSFCIHYLSGSWFSKRHKIVNKLKSTVGLLLGYNFVRNIRNLLSHK